MHPLPYDVTRVSTYDIVEKLRCEAKEGLRGVPYGHPILKHTVIGYDFTFDITEDNNLNSGGLNFNRPGFRDGSHFELDFTGSATRKRENKRQFRVLESLQKLSAADCSDTGTRANWIYPITGAIGLDEVLSTYVRLERLTDFGTGDIGTQLGKDSVVFSDDITYTTEIGGSATPTLELASIVGKFRLTKATITGNLNRKDIHSVVVALAQDGQPVDLPAFARLTNVGLDVGRSRQGARAVDAVATRGAKAPTRVIYELERRRLLREDQQLFGNFIEAIRAGP
jgi:hypothetical protein